MEVDDPARLPATAASAAAASRKRNGQQSDSDSEDTHVYSLSSEDTSDDDFQLVQSRRAKRRNTRTSSSSSTQTVRHTQRPDANTIIFVPLLPTVNMKLLNRQSVSMSLEALVPNEILDIRVNTRKNLLAVDVQHAAALNTLRSVTDIDGIQVRSYIPLGSDVVSGVIYDVDVAILNNDLPILIKPANDEVIVDIKRLGSSRCVKIAFKGKYIPSHVKVGHFRHAVRPFIQKPLQCRKCMRLGHVSSVCENQAACPRCAEPHAADKCGATVMKCSNCGRSHEASSRKCPLIRKEMAILKEMARDHSSHREAAEKVRKRRSRRRRPSRKAVVSATRMPLPTTPPPPLPPGPDTVERTAQNKATEKTTPAESWPALPKRQHPPTESQQNCAGQPPKSTVRDLCDQDKQVADMLQSLINTMRIILNKLQTPAARSALQILDALNPVLASIV
ncbi:uncharacterized protein [Dermacentor albipictus]|uniref:uncharacterized protein n=1 Tax=Dermacentor albipictus TaxID=60249 RepID=UPI0038FCD849